MAIFCYNGDEFNEGWDAEMFASFGTAQSLILPEVNA